MAFGLEKHLFENLAHEVDGEPLRPEYKRVNAVTAWDSKMSSNMRVMCAALLYKRHPEHRATALTHFAKAEGKSGLFFGETMSTEYAHFYLAAAYALKKFAKDKHDDGAYRLARRLCRSYVVAGALFTSGWGQGSLRAPFSPSIRAARLRSLAYHAVIAGELGLSAHVPGAKWWDHRFSRESLAAQLIDGSLFTDVEKLCLRDWVTRGVMHPNLAAMLSPIRFRWPIALRVTTSSPYTRRDAYFLTPVKSHDNPVLAVSQIGEAHRRLTPREDHAESIGLGRDFWPSSEATCKVMDGAIHGRCTGSWEGGKAGEKGNGRPTIPGSWSSHIPALGTHDVELVIEIGREYAIVSGERVPKVDPVGVSGAGEASGNPWDNYEPMVPIDRQKAAGIARNLAADLEASEDRRAAWRMARLKNFTGER